MEALSLNADALRQPPPLVLTEVSRPISVLVDERVPIIMAETDLFSRNLIMNSHNSQQVFGSKTPKPRARATRQATKSEDEEKAGRGAVLIVDDVPDVTEMIGLLLKHAGYDVSTADSAKSALRLARKTNYDLVISDIGMPEMNGYELAEALRGLNNYNNTPMIAVTGYSEYDDRGRAVKAGFNVHLTKPIEPAQLLNVMNELLARAQSGH
jgi:two-component system chemotaxis response regulator CheY